MSHLTNPDQTSLVGRERELEWLAGQLKVALDGQGSLALISGEAGIGKSALVEELVGRALAQGVMVLAGGGHDLTTPGPFALWTEVVGRLESAPAPPAFLTPAGENEPVHSQAELFTVAVQYFVDLTAQGPLLILLEDLHWADRESLDLLRAIARRLVDRPALLIGTYRGTEQPPDAWLARLLPHLVREARAGQLDLGPLSLDDVRRLTAERYELDPDARERLVGYLFERAEGNPLFTLELLRGLESARSVRPGPDRWIVDDLAALPLPAFLRHLIDARLTRLPAEIRDRLSVAAIIGHDVPIALWSEVCEAPGQELLDTIERAATTGLVIALPDGHAIRFAHALFRQALYEMTLPPRRAALHRRIAEELASHPTADPDAVAWQFQAASDSRAADWLILAAERAQRAYAWRAAAERLIAAERIVADRLAGVELGWLHYRIGRLLRHSDTAAAVQRLRQAEQLGVWSRDPALTAYARFDLGHTEVLGGDFARGLERMLSGDALLDRLRAEDETDDISTWVTDVLPGSSTSSALRRPEREQLRVNPRRGTLVQWLVEPGRYDEAQRLGSAYLEQLERLSVPSAQHISSEGDAWYALGRIHAAMQRPEQAERAFDRAIDCYERIDHYLLVGATRRALLGEVILPYRPDRLDARRALTQQAEVAHTRAAGALPVRLPAGFAAAEALLVEGEWSQAHAVLTPVAARGATIESVRLSAVSQLGWLACHQGRYDEAWQRIREVLPAGPATEPGDTAFIPSIDLMRVAIDLALDQSNAGLAASWLVTLERWLDWSGTTRWRADAALSRARLCAFNGDFRQAREQASSADGLAVNPGQPLTQAAIRRLRGELAARDGELDTARAHLASALELARACAACYEIALTELALAEMTAAASEQASATEHLASAQATFERLGAAPALAKVERAAARRAERQAAHDPLFGLSAREREVLRLVATGMTDAEVAARLSISYRTVTTHLTSIFNKLGVNSRVLATRIAVENDLL